MFPQSRLINPDILSTIDKEILNIDLSVINRRLTVGTYKLIWLSSQDYMNCVNKFGIDLRGRRIDLKTFEYSNALTLVPSIKTYKIFGTIQLNVHICEIEINSCLLIPVQSKTANNDYD